MKKLLQSIGPAIIVAAVVLGPGSILTSSNVGATFGLLGLPVVIVSVVLLIGMVALSARLGAVYDGSLGDELACRVGRPITIAIGVILFVLIALFQSSNNVALVGGIEPLLTAVDGDAKRPTPTSADTGLGLGPKLRSAMLIGFNVVIVICLYRLRNLYRSVEGLMKWLIGLTTVAFLINFVIVFCTPRSFQPIAAESSQDWIPLLGMIGTTLSVAGAYYQAYLVKEKGWGIDQVQRSVWDSVLSISVLGIVTSVILLTSWRVFYGRPEPVGLSSVGDVAVQLQPLFGGWAKGIFCVGILAGAISSFLVNAMIGGTVLSDSLGLGSRLSDRWPIHFTTVALIVGGLVAAFSLAKEGSTVHLITLAQALTVLGMPALALALIYLGTRPELKGPRKVPGWMVGLAILGFIASCLVASLTANNVYQKIKTAVQPAVVNNTY